MLPQISNAAFAAACGAGALYSAIAYNTIGRIDTNNDAEKKLQTEFKRISSASIALSLIAAARYVSWKKIDGFAGVAIAAGILLGREVGFELNLLTKDRPDSLYLGNLIGFVSSVAFAGLFTTGLEFLRK